ncbi:flavodoxin-dependent (E)-4-hydroxy-3-methylbut-2-enyl-diphosphate synthase [bacterium]|nr:flavodoxin-dependent (E)-4-hydroxy-3-methylbut-2-enyl-diphosphate synthase [bacterium]MBU1024882.1 flavodoxin-dependent (E)-4-hydroxy-3-methylbut-2-enyl-diphosphate synthase [bacterium]
MARKKTKQISVGNVLIGGDAPVTVQSMTNTLPGDLKSTLEQIKELSVVGCDIVRVSFPTIESTSIIPDLKKESSIPIVADVHFNAKIALFAIEKGIDKLRINPGNIGKPEEVTQIAREASQKGIPIRVGVNSGSLPKDLEEKHKENIPMALKEGALRHIQILEDAGFSDIVIATKSSSVMETIEAYRLISDATDYPLHLGVTEAGTLFSGTIRSSVAMSILLNEGIGDTIRVSLSANPVEEIKVGIEILKSLGHRSGGVRVVACPTCARNEIDVQALAEELEKRVGFLKKDITIAVMGCVVNGPGEAKHADIGVTGGDGKGVLFRKGEKIRIVKECEILDAILEEIDNWE